MKLLLNIAIILFVSLPLTSFEDTNSSNELITLEVENIPLEGMVCRDVRTSCGGGSFFTNRACVNYETPDGRSGAIFLAQSIAGAMGAAACERMSQIKKVTAEIGN